MVSVYVILLVIVGDNPPGYQAITTYSMPIGGLSVGGRELGSHCLGFFFAAHPGLDLDVAIDGQPIIIQPE